MADDPSSTGGDPGRDGKTRRAFLRVVAPTAVGLAGVGRAGDVAGRRDPVPIVCRRDRIGEPETVRHVPRERSRRIKVYHELPIEGFYGRVQDVNGVTLVQRSDDPIDLAVRVYVEGRPRPARRVLPSRVREVPIEVERRETDRTRFDVCGSRTSEFHDPLPANVEIEGFQDDDFVGVGTLGLVCWTDGRTSGNVEANRDDGQGDDAGRGDDTGDREGDDDASEGREDEETGDGEGADGDDRDDARDGGTDDAERDVGHDRWGNSDGEETGEGDEETGGDETSEHDDEGEGEGDDEDELTACYVTAAHVVEYDRSDAGDQGEEGSDETDGTVGVAQHLRHEGRVEAEDRHAREELVGAYQAHSSDGDYGLDVALYRRREGTVSAAPLANAESRLGEIEGAWTHEGLTDLTTGEESLSVSFAGRSTCYATTECVGTERGSLLDYGAVYSPNELTTGDSGGPMVDEDGYLVGTVSYGCDSCDTIRGPTGQELLDRLGARLAGPGEDAR